MEAVQGVNIRYTNGMSFFICEITYINNGQYFDDNGFANNLDQLYNFLFSQMGFADNAVAWVINNANSVNFGTYPWQDSRIILTPRIASAGILAHELGHFFGLGHTFNNTTICLQSNSNGDCIDRRIIIRPDCSCNPEESTFCGYSWICSGNPCDCENSGDKIADTPVDPGNDFCGFGWATNSPCIVETPGGQQLEYNPDYNNVMSYYNQNSFSPQQLNLMLLSLNHPNRTYLTDTNEPTCTEYVNPTALANVDRIRYNGSAWTSDPLPGASMNIRDNIIPVDYNKTTNANGEYQVRSSLGVLSDVDVTIGQLEANNTAGIFAANNGLNTVDALKIRQHLLAVAPLPAPYALIAADVDNNGSLSLVDESLVKKVILGIDLEFANVPSWRFLPRYFLDPQWNFNIAFESNPFTASIQWQDNTTRGYNTTPGYLDDLDITVLSEDLADAGSWSFYAIKSGDVDFTANISAGGAMTLSARESGTSLEVLPHTAIPAGSTFTITVEAKTQKLTAAYQMGMQFDPSAFEILSLSKGEVDNFDLDDFGLQKASEGVFKTVWVEDKGRGMSFANKKKVFKIYCRAKQNIENLDRLIHLDDDILQNAFYDHKGNLIDAEIYLTVEPEEVTTV